MLKTGLSILLVTSSLAYAPLPAAAQSDSQRVTPAELKEWSDRKIEVIKLALQLKPDQEKFWPAIDQAMRARSAARRALVEKQVSLSEQQREFNGVALLRQRSEAVAQRAARLKASADAWEPLYQTLDDKQKQRLRVVALYIAREIRDAADSRMQDDDEDEDE